MGLEMDNQKRKEERERPSQENETGRELSEGWCTGLLLPSLRIGV